MVTLVVVVTVVYEVFSAVNAENIINLIQSFVLILGTATPLRVGRRSIVRKDAWVRVAIKYRL